MAGLLNEEIAQLGMSTKEGAESIVNTYNKEQLIPANSNYGKSIITIHNNSIKTDVTEKLKSGSALPWQQSHDGNVEKSFFPLHNYTPSGITAVYLKMQEQKLETNDPRWYTKKDIRDLNSKKDFKDTFLGRYEEQNPGDFNMSDYIKALDAERAEGKELDEFRPKPEGKETHLQLRIPVNGKDVLIEGFFYNGSQILGIPPYTPQYEKSEQKTEVYHPEKTNNFFRPKETLRADLVNWLNSLETHTPFTPPSFDRSQEVLRYLKNTENTTFVSIANQASEISEKMLQTEKSKVITNAENNLSNPSVALPCHNPVTGQIYTQAGVSEHQQQSQSGDVRYLPPQEIDKLGMTIKEGAKPVVNTYNKENEAGQPAQHFEMLFNGKDIKGLPPLKIISEKISIGIAKVKESIQNIGNKTIQRNAKENDGGGYEM